MEQHEELLKELKKTTIHFYQGELDVYFEDLMSKLDKLDNNILMTSKSVNSLMDSYNGLMNIQTNMTIKVLTIFTVFLGIASSISSIYGMNVNLPFQEYQFAFLIVMSIIVGLISSIYRIFKIYEII